MKRLNIKRVNEVIGNQYTMWNRGDVVLINAQTGSGKTSFIKNVLLDQMQFGERMLYLCNRVSLKRQFKLDLLNKYNLPIPIDNNGLINLQLLDNITSIGNIEIISYHQLQIAMMKEQYQNLKCNLNYYKYIICDEYHFFIEDSTFNNKTRYSYNKILENTPQAIKIFMTATDDEVKNSILSNFQWQNYNGFSSNIKIWNYTTGIDYSYVTPKYFRNINDIIQLIMNDSSDNKWLIFVSNKGKGDEIKAQLKNKKIDVNTIYSQTKNKEINNIINNSKFNCKVLITTKVLENGINLNDEKLTNIVIMAWNKTEFIQELGRKRIDINNAQEINLFIPTRYRKSFIGKLKVLEEIEDKIQLFYNNRLQFNYRFDNNVEGLNNQIFFNQNGQWQVNNIGAYKLNLDIWFMKRMINRFNTEGEFAFVKEQLEWINLGHTFNENNLIGNVVDDSDKNKFIDYLENIVGKKLFKEQQQELSNLIIKELTTIAQDVDYRTTKLKPSTLEEIIRNQLELPYAVSKTKQETKGVNRGKRYIIISKLL
ncbi:DEAD/DEAH box helicase [Clostridium botulinum C]|uniref:helicase-related protein n=1 Tax=Clostridium botulinum TaxID=1491 RepID=UPI001E467129|nr:DEAD/DEAH box helicase [Clostridium botulinum]MCD3217808.1 DEAD/DEAH box helicase [Clostridium botulinum C]